MKGSLLPNLKVVEYCHMVSGPYCGKLLADLGAEVIKIEEPKKGDEARKRGPFPKDIPHPERSGLFLYLNTNKLGITLNLANAKGREILLQLPNRGAHLGFVEMWWLVNPLAAAGIAVACWRPKTRFPHAGHVLLSTWASLLHTTMALGDELSAVTLVVVSFFLFLAVWIPCCTSDIVFPLLCAREYSSSGSGPN